MTVFDAPDFDHHEEVAFFDDPVFKQDPFAGILNVYHYGALSAWLCGVTQISPANGRELLPKVVDLMRT